MKQKVLVVPSWKKLKTNNKSFDKPDCHKMFAVQNLESIKIFQLLFMAVKNENWFHGNSYLVVQ